MKELSMKTVPVFEAKNRFSELIAAVEHGDEVTITRRGVPVARLVAQTAEMADASGQRQQVASALERLRQIRAGLLLEGDLKAVARAGLD
jgi:prevent-host-death family protein